MLTMAVAFDTLASEYCFISPSIPIATAFTAERNDQCNLYYVASNPPYVFHNSTDILIKIHHF